MSKHDQEPVWEPAPRCFSCGREIGTDPEDVLYLGWGRRAGTEQPGWVATVCACPPVQADEVEVSPCVETAETWAAGPGEPLTPDEYRRWLATA